MDKQSLIIHNPLIFDIALLAKSFFITRKLPKSCIVVPMYKNLSNTGVNRFIIVPIPPFQVNKIVWRQAE